jgi:hypothetical protein
MVCLVSNNAKDRKQKEGSDMAVVAICIGGRASSEIYALQHVTYICERLRLLMLPIKSTDLKRMTNLAKPRYHCKYEEIST